MYQLSAAGLSAAIASIAGTLLLAVANTRMSANHGVGYVRMCLLPWRLRRARLKHDLCRLCLWLIRAGCLNGYLRFRVDEFGRHPLPSFDVQRFVVDPLIAAYLHCGAPGID